MLRFNWPAAVVVGLGAVVCWGGVGVGAADEQAYVLKYTRAVKVGQKTEHDVTSTVTIQNTPVGNGLTLEQMQRIGQPINVSLKGKFVREVLETTAKGEVAKMKLTFLELSDNSTGKMQAVVPAGTQVMMTLAEGADPEVTGGDGQTKLDPAVKTSIRQAVNARQGMGPDELLGGSTARKVGESWRLDKDVLMKSLAGSDRPADKEKLEGTAKVLRVETLGGEKCVVVESVVVAKDVRVGGSFMRGTVKASGMSVKQTFEVPVDAGAMERGVARESRLTMTVEYPENSPLQRLDVTATDKREERVESRK